MRKKKNNLDEMQELKMLRIEHNGFWLGFAGLAAAIVIQMFHYGPDCGDYVIGEFAVFICLGVYIMAGCIRNGVWDRRLAPSWKVNLCASLLAGVAGGGIRFLLVYREYHMLSSCAAVGAVVAVYTFLITFALLSVCLMLYQQREKRLEGELPQERQDICDKRRGDDE